MRFILVSFLVSKMSNWLLQKISTASRSVSTYDSFLLRDEASCRQKVQRQLTTPQILYTFLQDIHEMITLNTYK